MGSPRADALAQADGAARTALIGDVVSALRPFMADGGLAFPTEAHLAVARAPAQDA